MIANVISRRYADALFNASLKSNIVDTVYSDIEELAERMETNREFQYFLLTPRIKKSRKVDLINQIFSGIFSEITLNFLCLLLEKRRQEYIKRIFGYYKILYDKHHNRAEIEATSSIELTDDEEAQIKSTLEKITGKIVMITNTIDPSLIGGLITKIGNTVYDDSIKGYLELMRKEMVKR
ncbi:ATP synthase F1 subunit delta [bacterium]|nr:ATP synthase F1 subunit delta [bacterium]